MGSKSTIINVGTIMFIVVYKYYIHIKKDTSVYLVWNINTRMIIHKPPEYNITSLQLYIQSSDDDIKDYL